MAEALGRLGSEAPRIDAGTGRVTIPVAGGRAVIAEAVRALDALAVEVDDIGLRRPTLDEVFLTLTGSPIDADQSNSTDDSTGESTDQPSCPPALRPGRQYLTFFLGQGGLSAARLIRITTFHSGDGFYLAWELLLLLNG